MFIKTGVEGMDSIAGWYNVGEFLTAVCSKTNIKTPNCFELSISNYPNPFNPKTKIAYYLPEAGVIKLSIYNISGRLIDVIVDGWRGSGIHEFTFDGSKLPSGMYISKLTTNGAISTGKMLLIK